MLYLSFKFRFNYKKNNTKEVFTKIQKQEKQQKIQNNKNKIK